MIERVPGPDTPLWNPYSRLLSIVNRATVFIRPKMRDFPLSLGAFNIANVLSYCDSGHCLRIC
jgi:hypothetical protein